MKCVLRFAVACVLLVAMVSLMACTGGDDDRTPLVSNQMPITVMTQSTENMPTPTAEASPAPPTPPATSAITPPSPGQSPTLPETPAGQQDDHSDKWEEATQIAVGESRTGYIERPGDVDLFVFDAKAGTIYSIISTLGTLESSDFEVSYIGAYPLPIFDTSHLTGHPLNEPAARVNWAPDYDGRILVGIRGDGTGDYQIVVEKANIEDDYPNTIGEVMAVRDGHGATGNIEYVGDKDVFWLDLKEGETYHIAVSHGTTDGLNVRITDQNDSKLVYFANTGSVVAQGYWQMPFGQYANTDPHRYYIQVVGYNLGAYTISVEREDRKPSEGPLATHVDPGPATVFIPPALWAALQLHADGDPTAPRLLVIEFGYFYERGSEDNQSLIQAIRDAGGASQAEGMTWEIPTGNILPVIQRKDVIAAVIHSEEVVEEVDDPRVGGAMPLVLEAYELGIPAELAVQYAMYVLKDTLATFLGWDPDLDTGGAITSRDLRNWLKSHGIQPPPHDDESGMALMLPVRLVRPILEAFPTVHLSAQELGHGLELTRWRWPVETFCWEQSMVAGISGIQDDDEKYLEFIRNDMDSPHLCWEKVDSTATNKR